LLHILEVILDIKQKAMELVAQMTTAEKASLCSGKNFWYMKGIPRLNLPEIMMPDGPHGLRKQDMDAKSSDISHNVPATCFPTASASACSFDRDLLREIGSAIGEECRQEGVSVLLGPGINIKRSPLCGRNFEYFSEDPLLSGEMAAGFINGLQSQNVGASLKHFAANNQEKRRMVYDAVMDERTFREIYLKGFELAIKKAKPWTVMCSYNRLFGEYASQNKRLLTTILRNEWGFEGVVVSDWGATDDRVKGLMAGLDLEMPFIDGTNDKRIEEAIKNGTLDPKVLDVAACRLVELILRSGDSQDFRYSIETHRALVRKAASESAVLLKNEAGILPDRITARTAVVGAFAKFPRYQGTGSSKINPIMLSNPFDELRSRGLEFEYADGYSMDSDLVDENLVREACSVAEGKEIVYLFSGLPDAYEAESFDRDNMAMPANHVRLIEAVSKVNKHIVVILLGGAPMELPWSSRVEGILLMYLGGEACAEACVDILLGVSNPCGKLAETWPLLDADVPSSGNFPGYPLTVEYREGIFVGYRYYDTARQPVRYPFGFGLSYTSYQYSDMQLSKGRIGEKEQISISCRVQNTGDREGKEIVQLYISRQSKKIPRPEQELKGFEKIHLLPGETKVCYFQVSYDDLAYYDTARGSWMVEEGDYEIRISASSRDIRLKKTIRVEGVREVESSDLRNLVPGYFDLSQGIHIPDDEFVRLLCRPLPPRERVSGSKHTINSTLADIHDRWLGRILLSYFNNLVKDLSKDNPSLGLMAQKMMMDLPLRNLTMMASGGMRSISILQVEGLVEILNGNLIKGIKKLLTKPPR
jgi:beta-glucosidase